MRDETYPEIRLTEQFTLHLFELPTFERKMQQAPWGDSLAEWLHFLNHAPEEKEKTMQAQYTNPAVHKAFTVLEKLRADEEARYRAEAREMALKNRATELAYAREESLEEGRQEGVLIGTIHTLQEILRQPITPQETLQTKPIEELRRLLEQLKSEMQTPQK